MKYVLKKLGTLILTLLAVSALVFFAFSLIPSNPAIARLGTEATPEKVEKLILTVTLSRPNETVLDVIGRWTDMAEHGDYKGIMLDTAERSYSEKRLKTARREYRLLGNFGKPKSFDRFLTQAESCITHDAYDELSRIACPTLVIGGTEDKIVTGEASKEIAGQIPGSSLCLYEGLGHGLYEEAPDFLQRVADFCME